MARGSVEEGQPLFFMDLRKYGMEIYRSFWFGAWCKGMEGWKKERKAGRIVIFGIRGKLGNKQYTDWIPMCDFILLFYFILRESFLLDFFL